MESMVGKDFLQNIYFGKRVFITGHTGFKGTWLSLWLNELGAILKGYALAPDNEKCIYNVTKPFQKAESIIADIRNKELLQKEILDFQPDFIFHLAAQPLVRLSYDIPSETFEINAIGTANLLEALKRLDKKCTVIIITTDKVYENIEQDVLYKETDRLGGYDPYSASKACTEIVLDSFRNSFFNPLQFSHHKKAIASARAGNVIGGGDYSKDRIISDIVNALSTGEDIVVRNPSSVRPWQHVLEPLSGYLLLGASLNGDIKYNGAYNFGPSPQDHLTVKDLVEIAIAVWGNGNWQQPGLINQPHEAGLLKLDITKAKEILGWQPKWNARKAIEMTIEWYKNADGNAKMFSLEQIHQYMAYDI